MHKPHNTADTESHGLAGRASLYSIHITQPRVRSSGPHYLTGRALNDVYVSISRNYQTSIEPQVEVVHLKSNHHSLLTNPFYVKTLS